MSVIFSSGNGDPPRVAGTTQSSDNCTNAFPWDNHHVQQKGFMYILAIFSQRILKRHGLKGPDLIELIIFTSSWTRTFLNEIKGLVLWMCGSEEENDC